MPITLIKAFGEAHGGIEIARYQLMLIVERGKRPSAASRRDRRRERIDSGLTINKRRQHQDNSQRLSGCARQWPPYRLPEMPFVVEVTTSCQSFRAIRPGRPVEKMNNNMYASQAREDRGPVVYGNEMAPIAIIIPIASFQHGHRRLNLSNIFLRDGEMMAG